MELTRRELVAVMLAVGIGPFAVGAGTVAFAEAGPVAATQSVFPQRPITIVVGYPPGGGGDRLVRSLAKYLTKLFGQKVIIQHRPGAASNIAARAVARAEPDGYTLFLSGRPNALHRTLGSNVDYDFAKDLLPVGLLAVTPNLIVARADSPIKDIADLIRLARTHPGEVTCASSGVGSTGHLLCELFQREANVVMEHVPHTGSATALVEVIGGRVDVQFENLAATMVHLRAGTLRVIAVLSNRRLAIARDVATMEESGFPNFNVDTWGGIMVPAGTPPHVVAGLNKMLNSALMEPGLQEDFISMGYGIPIGPNSAAAFGDLLAQEIPRWGFLLDRLD